MYLFLLNNSYWNRVWNTARVVLARTVKIRVIKTTSGAAVLTTLLYLAAMSVGAAPTGQHSWVIDHWGPSDGLPQSSVNGIAQTSDGYLWLATFNGLARFDGQSFRVLNEDNSGISKHRLTALKADGETLYIGDFDGQVSQMRAGAFSLLSRRAAENFDQITDIALSDANELIITRRRSGRSRLLPTGDESVSPPDVMAKDRPYSDTVDQPSAVLRDREGNTWVGTRGQGLYCFLSNGDHLHWTSDSGLSSNIIQSILEDREGNIWVGTFTGGLLRFKPGIFATYKPAFGANPDDLFTSVAELSDGRILLGARVGGLYAAGDRELLPIDSPADGITAMARRKDGSLLIGSSNGHLYQTDNSLATWSKLPVSITGNDRRIFAILEDTQGVLWVGVNEGVIRLQAEEQILIAPGQGLAGPRVRAILEDQDGSLWFGTQDHGLSHYAGGVFSNYAEPDGLASDVAWTLHQDVTGSIWVGSFGGGLSRIKQGEPYALTTRDGLWDNLVAGIISDEEGRLWLGSSRGIFYLEPDAQERLKKSPVHSTAFDEDSGITDSEITGGYQPSAIRAQDGSLWMASNNGAIRVQPGKLRVNKLPPVLNMEGIVVDDRLISPDGSGTVTIPAGSHRVDFNFIGISLSALAKVRYRYMLRGYDSDWQSAGHSRLAEYTELPPGEYEFLFNAANNDGVWGEKPMSVNIHAEPWFWQTYWFRLATFVVALSALVGAIRYLSQRRLRIRMQELEQAQALEEERRRIARDLHDDVGARLTNIHLLNERASRKIESGEDAATDLNDIKSRTRELAQAMDEVVWAVDPGKDNAADLIDYLSRYADDFFAASPIRLLQDVPPDPSPVTIDARIRHAVFSVFKEALNNAAKYSEAEKIHLLYSVRRDLLEIRVSDDGVGFGDRHDAGNGLANMRARMREIGGSCDINARDGKGCVIAISLPLHKVSEGGSD